MPIRPATLSDIEHWVDLRAQLWLELSPDAHREEAMAMLARPSGEFAAFLDDDGGHVHAFAEVALRRDYVNGCETSPVAYLEGIFVRREFRGTGIGRELLDSAKSWARRQGCSELASDADLTNRASQAFHEAVGFEETERVVFFRVKL